MSLLRYERLDPESRDIRVLVLFPGTWSSPIRTSLQKMNLDDEKIYEAVSYAWGEPDDTRGIFVEEAIHQIPSNLEACLRYLRKPTKPVVLWADAICINQKDTLEKADQVKLMGEIFRHCSSTYIWLGIPNTSSPTPESHRSTEKGNGADPFYIIKHFAQDRHLASLSCFKKVGSEKRIEFFEDSAFVKIWKAFTEASQKSWWSRFWCVQECLLSPSATIVFGHWRLPWKTVKTCQVNYNKHVLHCCSESASAMPEHYTFYADMNVAHTQLELDHGTTWRLPPAIPSTPDLLIRSFSYKACRDPRDKIFGICGLLEHSGYGGYNVDYSLSTASAYQEAMKTLLRGGGGDLQCLTGSGYNSQKHDLPSWVRNFGHRPDIEKVTYEIMRFHSYDLYNASASLKGTPIIQANSSLSLCGRRIDTIKQVGSAVKSRSWQHIRDVLQTWYDLADLIVSNVYLESPAEGAFWRTVMGDSLYEGITMPGRDDVWRRMSNEDSASLQDWLSSVLWSMSTNTEPPISAWLRTLVSVTYGRAMFQTLQGYLGLCGPKTQEGDEVWILKGGKVPFVLRPCYNDSHSLQDCPPDWYKLVGDAYLHGYMDGEIVKDGPSYTCRVVLR